MAYIPAPQPLALGGTASATAALARDAIVYAGRGAVAPALPYTVTAGVSVISATTSGTVNLPALSTYADMQEFIVRNDSSAAIDITFDGNSSETVDGSATAVVTIAARSSAGVYKKSSSAWGSVQPSSGTVNPVGVGDYELTETNTSTVYLTVEL